MSRFPQCQVCDGTTFLLEFGYKTCKQCGTVLDDYFELEDEHMIQTINLEEDDKHEEQSSDRSSSVTPSNVDIFLFEFASFDFMILVF